MEVQVFVEETAADAQELHDITVRLSGRYRLPAAYADPDWKRAKKLVARMELRAESVQKEMAELLR